MRAIAAVAVAVLPRSSSCLVFSSPPRGSRAAARVHVHVHAHARATRAAVVDADDAFATMIATDVDDDADADWRHDIRPRWIPMELAELASEDLSMSFEEYARTHADAEAYTSCDDDGDDLHECDGLGSYLGPIRWLRMTDEARNGMDDAHLSVWRDVWSRPRMAVDLADRVSRECLRCVRLSSRPA
jgi:hypothetical protein